MLTMPEAQRGDFLMSNWQSIEPIVQTDFMTFLNASGGDFSDRSLNEDIAMFRTQLGEAPPEGIEGKAINDRLVNPMTGDVMADFSDPVGEDWQRTTIYDPAGNPQVVEYDRNAKDPQATMRTIGGGKPAQAEPGFQLSFGEGGQLTGIGYGSAPKGKDPAIVRGENGAVVTPGPQQQLYNKSRNALADYQVTNDLVLEDVDRAIEQAGAWTTGFVGSKLAAIEGTPAYDLARTLDSVKANIGFDKLQEMRDNSPTGGALGQVSEWELQLLQSVLGSIEQAQTKEQFVYHLNRIKEIKIEAARRREAAFKQDFPSISEQAEFMHETQTSIDDLVAKYAGGS